MIKSLLQKEWLEQRWKIAFATVILAGYTTISLRARIMPDDQIYYMGIIFSSVLLPIFASMSIVATERANRTFNTLIALPVSPKKIIAAKLIISSLIILIPILISAILSLIIAGNREVSYYAFIYALFLTISFSLTFFLWSTVFNIRQPTEARAAIIAVAVLIIIIFIIMSAEFYFKIYGGPVKWYHTFHPFIYVMFMLKISHSLLNDRILATLIQLIIAFALITTITIRFSRLTRGKS